jgi:hypothetical protein
MHVFRAILLIAVLSLLPQVGVQAAHPVYESGPVQLRAGAEATTSDQLDALVMNRLRELNLKPALVCSDAVFLRRAYLVVIGTLPTEEEARTFLAATDPDRRARLIDELLQREEFADYWTMKWGDLLRVKAEFPIKLWPNAAQAYHRWIYTSVRSNKPFHHFVREMLLANGSNFRDGQVNFYRAMQDRSPRGIASTVALTFMGERADRWPPKKLDALAGFFGQIAFKPTSEWKEEIVYFDPAADKDGIFRSARFPDGTAAKIEPGRQDPRVVFADWLLRPENPWFSRNIANRVWSWLMGRGVVHEPDDLRADNPPSNPALLEFLQREFVTSRCDMQHLFRVILKSQTFQLSSIPAQDTPEAAANFAHYPLRRMEAEVLIDALNQVTGTAESYSSPIPEPFTFVPEDVRAIALADGSITSSFLELFGRPPRDTGFESERNRTTSAAQRLHLLNSSHLHGKVQSCPLVASARDRKAPPGDLAESIFLTILSRPPTAEERAAIENHASATSIGARGVVEDTVWALLNQSEFFYIH